jgi:A nuclease family of the HNH/ENDO VII superfamily with conserved AHH
MTDANHKEEFEKRDYHIPEKKKEKPERGCVTKCQGSKMPKTGTRHGSYRKNGYDTISNDSKKKSAYNRTFSAAKFKNVENRKEVPWGTKKRKATRSDPSQKPGSWDIGHAKYTRNFRYAHTPYNHDYHHIMPMDCILDGLGAPQVKLLMWAEYNLNDGRNLIILPRGEYFARMVQLPYHASNHPQYIAQIKSQIAKLDQKLKTGNAVHKRDKAKTAKNDLMDWEDEMFNVIREFGEQQVAAKKKSPDINDVQITTEKTFS